MNTTSSTALYRHFDKNKNLLYIGVSINPFLRLRQHKLNRLWFWEVAEIHLEWFETRELAEAAESNAILNEKPRYNIVREVHFGITACANDLRAALTDLV